MSTDDLSMFEKKQEIFKKLLENKVHHKSIADVASKHASLRKKRKKAKKIKKSKK
jgi:hypothetical protein